MLHDCVNSTIIWEKLGLQCRLFTLMHRIRVSVLSYNLIKYVDPFWCVYDRKGVCIVIVLGSNIFFKIILMCFVI